MPERSTMNLILLFMAWMPILVGSMGIGLISYYFYKWAKGIRLVRYRLAGEICFILVLLYFLLFFLGVLFGRSLTGIIFFTICLHKGGSVAAGSHVIFPFV